jgi:hypothetical protein
VGDLESYLLQPHSEGLSDDTLLVAERLVAIESRQPLVHWHIRSNEFVLVDSFGQQDQMRCPDDLNCTVSIAFRNDELLEQSAALCRSRKKLGYAKLDIIT